jgi:hypothetical protein
MGYPDSEEGVRQFLRENTTYNTADIAAAKLTPDPVCEEVWLAEMSTGKVIVYLNVGDFEEVE